MWPIGFKAVIFVLTTIYFLNLIKTLLHAKIAVTMSVIIVFKKHLIPILLSSTVLL